MAPETQGLPGPSYSSPADILLLRDYLQMRRVGAIPVLAHISYVIDFVARWYLTPVRDYRRPVYQMLGRVNGLEVRVPVLVDRALGWIGPPAFRKIDPYHDGV